MSVTEDARTALEQLGRIALREHSMDSLLQRVVDLARDVMPGDNEASVLVLVKDQPSTVVHSGRLALDCDERQYARGEGPCLEAARTGQVVEVVDSRGETRWPDYARAAAAAGALSSLSTPLPVSEGVSGALNVYAREVDVFDADSRAAAAAFVPYAAVAVDNMLAFEDARGLAANLQRALESRAVIDQAKGILIERYKLAPDQAFQFLARTSMTTNRKLRDVADHLVHTGEIPTS